MEWLCLVYKEDEDEIKSRLARLKGNGLLQEVDLSSGTISVHDLYRELAQLVLEGKLDESTDLEKRRWVYVLNGDLTELERTPGGGCWQQLRRLGIGQARSGPPDSTIRSLEGIEWQYFSNLVVLELRGLPCVCGTLDLKGLKCLRSLQLFDVNRLDRLEGLEGLKNLAYVKWFSDYWKHRDEARNYHIGQFSASLRVLQIINGIVWLGPDVLPGCNNLCKLELSGVRADNLGLSNCSSLQSVELGYVSKLQTLFLPITARWASSLQALEVRGCKDLADIPGLDQLIGLERLMVEDCPRFQELPDLKKTDEIASFEIIGPAVSKAKGGSRRGGWSLLSSAASRTSLQVFGIDGGTGCQWIRPFASP